MRIEDIHKRIQELMEEGGWSKYKLANECNMNALLDEDDIHLFLQQYEEFTNYILDRQPTEMPKRPGQNFGQKKG